MLPFIGVVKKFFVIPATSVPWKQFFSAAGDLVNKKRSRKRKTSRTSTCRSTVIFESKCLFDHSDFIFHMMRFSV